MHEQDHEITFNELFVPLTTVKAIIFFIIIGLFVYINSLFSGFVWDDKIFIVNNVEVHSLDLIKSFEHNLFNSSGYYRPIPALYFATLYSLFGQQTFFYHILQFSLHIFIVYLLYVIFKKYFRKEISFILSLVFLIHPINVESVAYIGATQSELFTVSGLLAFLLINKDPITTKKYFILFLLFLLMLLTKETAILFLVIIILWRYLFKKDNIFKIICVEIAAVIIYFAIRFFIGNVFFEKVANVSIAKLSFIERLINIPSIFSYYLSTLLFPKTLVIDQQWIINNISISNFYIPLIVDLTFIICIFLTGRYIFKKQKHLIKVYLFFTVWFLLGVISILQIYPLDMTVADRWFYFPLIGLLGMIGTYASIIHWRFAPKNIAITAIVIILFALSLRTIIRNADYSDDINLRSHDIKNLKLQQSSSVGGQENDLAQDLIQSNRLEEAEKYALDSLQYNPTPNRYNTLGMIYAKKNNQEKAEYWYKQSIATGKINLAFNNYATLLINKKEYIKAKGIIHQGLKNYPNDYNLWVRLAYAEYFLGNQDDALKAANKAYQLNNTNDIAAINQSIKTHTLSL